MNDVYVTVKCSQYGNTYGSLKMIHNETSGEYFLQMDDCFGPDFFGPLTEDQKLAFEVLLDVPQTNRL